MASVKLLPVDGPRPNACPADGVLCRVSSEKRRCEQQLQRWTEWTGSEGQTKRHFRDMQWLEKFIQDTQRPGRLSNSPVHLHAVRQLGNQRLQAAQFSCDYATRHLVRRGLLREHVYGLVDHNKVFCSQWLRNGRGSGDSVVLGTKCNSVRVTC